MERNNVLNQGTLSTIATQEQLREQNAADFEREQNVLNPREDRAAALTEAGAIRTEEDRIKALDGQREAERLLTDIRTTTEQKLELAADIKDPVARKTAMDAITNAPNELLNPEKRFVEEASQNPILNEIAAGSTSVSRAMDMSLANNDTMALYKIEMEQGYGEGTALAAINEIGADAFSASGAGDAAAILRTLKTQFKNVPESVMAHVIRQTKRGRLKGVISNATKIDYGEVKRQLRSYQENRTGISQEFMLYEKASTAIGDINEKVGNLSDQLARAIQSNDPGLQMQIQNRIVKLREKQNKVAEGMPESVKKILFPSRYATPTVEEDGGIQFPISDAHPNNR